MTVKIWAIRQGEANSRAIMREGLVVLRSEIAVPTIRTEGASDHTALSADFRNEETEVQKG